MIAMSTDTKTVTAYDKYAKEWGERVARGKMKKSVISVAKIM